MPVSEHTSRVMIDTVGIDPVSPAEAVDRVMEWAHERRSAYVSVANVHVTMTCARNVQLRQAVRHADLVVPDGAPVAWWLRRVGYKNQARVDGPGLMLELCRRCADEGLSIYLYGGRENTLERLRRRLTERVEQLEISGAFSPPFRSMSNQETDDAIESIAESGASVIFVGLGAPKQELWMIENHERIPGVLLGVGAAFDFHAGDIARAPEWMQRAGLEWLHRLCTNPRRLWRRYLLTNSRFLLVALNMLLSRRRGTAVRR